MKYTRNFLAVTVFVLLFLSPPIYGQSTLRDCFDMELTLFKRDRDRVLVEGNILLRNMKIAASNQLMITPELRAANGQSLPLPPVVINGKTRHKLYYRSLMLQGKSTDSEVYSVNKAATKYSNRSIPYRIAIPYQSWMRNASMYVVADLCGCGGTEKDHQEKQIGPSINLSQYAPKPNFVVPQREDFKRRSESGAAFLIFEQSKWNILPNLRNNREELNKIDQSLKYINEEPTARITGITISAYASPEGPYELNMTLSKNRAKALLDYIQKNYSLPKNIKVSSEGFGEDWDYLVELIRRDPKVESRDQVLRIINTVNIFDGREKQLMDLDGGRPYRYLLNNLYPLLRRSVYQIEYSVPEFGLERAEQLLETKPNMLSLDEMYRIASRYEAGSARFDRVFIIAGQTYPNNPIACVNAAAVAIWENDFALAKRFLENWPNEPLAWNNLGIICMSELRLDEAEWYLTNARSAGIKEADTNLRILQQLKEAVQLYDGL